ncbi:Rhomboid protease GlpG [Vibrio stylophorae]|uniref:Rhomboid protease GlpG n=1 Tax=Vibrio stylophorae TaxID=659351 RepID=A0ABM8ZPQ0_9VIBR|nr:rhomboid family intramembrane serine protease [Vibrio stylophorae]CAH0532293.1 Rhomboid protease GlpG [Vibrio stylophorae]
MQAITRFRNPRAAQAFADYLLAQGYQVQLEVEDDQLVLLAPQVDQANIERELEAFIRNPQDPKYLDASWQVGQTRNRRWEMRTSGNPILQNIVSQGGVLTFILMAMPVLSYLLLHLVPGDFISLIHFPVNSDQLWQVWRLVSYVMVAPDFLTVIFAVLFVWYLGGQVERQLGSNKLMQLILMISLFSGFSQVQFETLPLATFDIWIYGLAAYVWLTGLLRPQTAVQVPGILLLFFIFWMGIGAMQQENLFSIASSLLTSMLAGSGFALWDYYRDKRA